MKRSIAAFVLFVQLLVALVVHVQPRPTAHARSIDVALAGAQITRLPERVVEIAKPDAVATTTATLDIPEPTHSIASPIADAVRIDDAIVAVPRARGPPAHLV